VYKEESNVILKWTNACLKFVVPKHHGLYRISGKKVSILIELLVEITENLSKSGILFSRNPVFQVFLSILFFFYKMK